MLQVTQDRLIAQIIFKNFVEFPIIAQIFAIVMVFV